MSFLFMLTEEVKRMSLKRSVFLFLQGFVCTPERRKLSFAMASAPVPAGVSGPTISRGSLRDDLTCAVCCDLFREPVMLACMHHFCKLCICEYWRGTEGRVKCPQCRKEFSSKHFQTNYLVSSIVEKIRVATSDTYIQNCQVSVQLPYAAQQSLWLALVCSP